jgi:hypothetical protein
MENNIPTADEFFLQNNGQHQSVSKMMIEFAKIHVEAALKEASEDANMDSDYYQALQVYPLTNIK